MYHIWKYIFKKDISKRALMDIEILKWFQNKNITIMAKYWRRFIYYKYNIDIHINAKIGSNIKIPHPAGIVIGPDAIIGNDCVISQGVTIGGNFNKTKKQIIGENTFLGAGAKILGDVIIGSNCIIGANSVITKNINSNKVVVGNNRVLEKEKADYFI